jgi:cell wall-associated NlpC family hydrolase
MTGELLARAEALRGEPYIWGATSAEPGTSAAPAENPVVQIVLLSMLLWAWDRAGG